LFSHVFNFVSSSYFLFYHFKSFFMTPRHYFIGLRIYIFIRRICFWWVSRVFIFYNEKVNVVVKSCVKFIQFFFPYLLSVMFDVRETRKTSSWIVKYICLMCAHIFCC
jgi:hypothetical protein